MFVILYIYQPIGILGNIRVQEYNYHNILSPPGTCTPLINFWTAMKTTCTIHMRLLQWSAKATSTMLCAAHSVLRV